MLSVTRISLKFHNWGVAEFSFSEPEYRLTMPCLVIIQSYNETEKVTLRLVLTLTTVTASLQSSDENSGISQLEGIYNHCIILRTYDRHLCTSQPAFYKEWQ